MAVTTAEFNPAGATNGATIATSDTGDQTAWNFVNGAPKYDNTHALFGKSLAAKFAASASTPFLRWDTAFGSTSDSYGRLYIYFSSFPAAAQDIVLSYIPGSGAGWSLKLLTTQKLQLYAAGTPNGAASTTVLATGQWYRLEWHFHTGSAGSASATCSIYTSPDSATPAETLNVASATQTMTPTAMAYGASSSNDTYTCWLASIADHGTSAIGPFPVNSVAPAVSGSTAVGSTLTCDGGTWNGTFTLGYQWTSNGSNIAGATSSTYTTQAGDVGNAIGCTVTATGQQATNEQASQASGNTVTVTSSGGGGGSSTLALASHPGRFLHQKGLR